MSAVASPVTPLRILLVDDSLLVREGIRAVLTAQAGDRPIEVVAEAVREVGACQPDVVLLDIRLPDGTGFTACREILKRHPGTRVLILTSFANDNFVYDAIAAGALGYLMKEVDPRGLVQAIREVASGKAIFDAEATTRMLRMLREGTQHAGAPEIAQLSAQERRVLALVAEGKTNKQIGVELKLSDNTVKNYLCNVFDKLQVKRRSQAAALFVQVTGGSSGQTSWPQRP